MTNGQVAHAVWIHCTKSWLISLIVHSQAYTLKFMISLFLAQEGRRGGFYITVVGEISISLHPIPLPPQPPSRSTRIPWAPGIGCAKGSSLHNKSPRPRSPECPAGSAQGPGIWMTLLATPLGYQLWEIPRTLIFQKLKKAASAFSKDQESPWQTGPPFYPTVDPPGGATLGSFYPSLWATSVE